MLSGFFSALFMCGSKLISRFILKDNREICNSGVMKVLSLIILFWFFFAVGTICIIIHSIISGNSKLLVESLFVTLGLAVSMIIIFFSFRRIAVKQENKEAQYELSKIARQVKATSLPELDLVFSEMPQKSPKIKYAISNQIERSILSMDLIDAKEIKLRIQSVFKNQIVQDHILEACNKLLETASKDDQLILNRIITLVEKNKATASALYSSSSSQGSAEDPVPKGEKAIIDISDNKFLFCPKCNTRQRSNRTRCMECGVFFSNAE